MQRSRFIVGLILIGAAVLVGIFGAGETTTPAMISLGILGIILIAISRRTPED